MQQRGTGFHICFCPQNFLLGSQEQPITELPRNPNWGFCLPARQPESICPGCCCRSPRVRQRSISFSCTRPFWDTGFEPNLFHMYFCCFLTELFGLIGQGFGVGFLLKELYLKLNLNGSYPIHSNNIIKYFEKQHF